MKLKLCLLLCFLACNSAVLTAQTSSATITQSGWYRVAINGPLVYGSGTSAGGNRAAARFILRDITSSLHHAVEFLGYVHYGKRPLQSRTKG